MLTPIAGHECIGGVTSDCPIETAEAMFEPIGILVSPDGKNVYVSAGAANSEGESSPLSAKTVRWNSFREKKGA